MQNKTKIAMRMKERENIESGEVENRTGGKLPHFTANTLALQPLNNSKA